MSKSKEQLMDSVVDRIWKKKEVTDQEVLEAFWDVDGDDDIRRYIRGRWFKERSVKENHITRKLNHFWPKMAECLQRARTARRDDATVRKVYRVENYKVSPSILGYIAACTAAEAKAKFDVAIPRFESGGTRYVEVHRVLPDDRVDGEVMARNADVASLISDRLNETQEAVKRYQAAVEQAQLRMDAMGIFMAMQVQSDDEAAPESTDAIAENPNENSEVPF